MVDIDPLYKSFIKLQFNVKDLHNINIIIMIGIKYIYY